MALLIIRVLCRGIVSFGIGNTTNQYKLLQYDVCETKKNNGTTPSLSTMPGFINLTLGCTRKKYSFIFICETMSLHKKQRVINNSVAIMKNWKIPFKRDDICSRLRINGKINKRRGEKNWRWKQLLDTLRYINNEENCSAINRLLGALNDLYHCTWEDKQA